MCNKSFVLVLCSLRGPSTLAFCLSCDPQGLSSFFNLKSPHRTECFPRFIIALLTRNYCGTIPSVLDCLTEKKKSNSRADEHSCRTELWIWIPDRYHICWCFPLTYLLLSLICVPCRYSVTCILFQQHSGILGKWKCEIVWSRPTALLTFDLTCSVVPATLL